VAVRYAIQRGGGPRLATSATSIFGPRPRGQQQEILLSRSAEGLSDLRQTKALAGVACLITSAGEKSSAIDRGSPGGRSGQVAQEDFRLARKTYVDTHASGVPLIEIVEPEHVRSAAPARNLQRLRGQAGLERVNDGNMEEGRALTTQCVVRPAGQAGVRGEAEVKNVNSFATY